MARTPLMQFLKTLSSDIGLGNVRDIPVAELVAERLAALSRRQFVAGAASLSASAAFPEAAFAAPSKPRIAIVGAGIAGLNAALTLQDAGIASTVYEASKSNLAGGCSRPRRSGRMARCPNGAASSLTPAMRRSSAWPDASACRWTTCSETRACGTPTGSLDATIRSSRPMRTGVATSSRLAKDLKAAGELTTYDKYTPEGQKLDQMSIAEWIDSRVAGGRRSGTMRG